MFQESPSQIYFKNEITHNGKIFAVCKACLHYAFAEMNLKRSKIVEVFEPRLRSLKLASFSPFVLQRKKSLKNIFGKGLTGFLLDLENLIW